MLYRVRYHIATYSGVVKVYSDDSEIDHEMIIAKARGQLRRQVGTLPYGSESWRVLRADEPDLEPEEDFNE